MNREVDEDEKGRAAELYSDELRAKMAELVDMSEPTIEEVRAKMEWVNADAALGPDGVNIMGLRNGGEKLIRRIHDLCCEIFRQAEWQQAMADSNMAPVPKKAGAEKEGEHRGASVSAHASKVATGILNDRMNAAIENIVGEYQFGFRRRRGTDDAVLALRLLEDQMCGSDKEMYVGFVDLVKAFDTVVCEYLFTILRAMGFPEKCINMIRSLYGRTRFRVKTRDGCSEWIEQSVGVRQGCCLSSGLFILFLEHVMRLMEENGSRGIRIADEVIGCMGYADDVAWVDENIYDFRKRMVELARRVKQVGMEMSTEKTKIMVMGRVVKDGLACELCGETGGEERMLICGDDHGRYGCGVGRHRDCGMGVMQLAEEMSMGGDEHWEWYCERCEDTKGRVIIGGSAIEEVNEFEYLGTLHEKSYDCFYTILHRMHKAMRCFRALRPLWRSRINFYVKGMAYKTLVRTVLLYGAAAWVMTKEDMSILEAWDAANLRHILHVSRRQHIRAEDCRNRLNIEKSIVTEVSQARLRMLLKIARSTLPKASYSCKYLAALIENSDKYSRGRRGRPNKTWVQCVTEDMQCFNFGLHSGMGLARVNAAKFTRIFLS